MSRVFDIDSTTVTRGPADRLHRRGFSSLLCFLIILACIATAGRPAWAQNRRGLQQQLGQVEQLFRAGQYPRAIALANELDAPMRQAFGENRDYGALLNLLAAAYGNVGETGQAEAAMLRSLRVFERIGGPLSIDVAICLNNLGEIAKRSGRIEQALDYFQRALAIQEARSGATSPAVANILNSIAATYIDGGRATEVEPILNRAIAIWRQTPRANPIDVSRPLTNLAVAYSLAGRYADAGPLFSQAIDLKRRALGPEHPDLIAPLNGLGDAYAATGRAQDAVTTLKYSLSISERIVGANHPTAIPVLTTLGSAYSAAGDTASAEATFQRLLTLQKNTLGPGHPSVALTLGNLAVVSANTGRLDEAVASSREAVATAAANMRNGRVQAAFKARTLFETHLRLLDQARRQSQPSFDAAAEAFRTAQWINESTAAGALNQLATRFSAGNGALAQLVREHQNAVSEYRRIDEALIAAMSSLRQRNPEQDAAMRAQSARLKARIAELEERLRADFPAYAGLAEQQPMSADDAKRLLKDNEALVYFHAAETLLHLFVVTRQELRWTVIPIGRAALADKVRLFRAGLDVGAAEQSLKNGKPELFDLDRAHDMYRLLFPADAGIISKQQWVIVPTGPLTAVPFGILVTAKAEPPGADGDVLAPYRTAKWLALETATSILPSVGSLKTVRVAAARAHAPKPMIGYGDPIFGGDDDTRLQRRDVRAAPRRDLDLAFSDFWTGAGIDRVKLSKSLPRLADTADELRGIAKSLQAQDAVVLGADATETAVKSAPLADYRVVYFSTHGLVAGDVSDIAEPSLAFSIPDRPTSLDDGLLTASEIARLQLNADWVVLSACNTVAGGKPGAEGLSGLVRAFFYAGARSVLVTHWSVLSDAATTLTTTTFKSLVDQPQLGRAEALRRAMADMIKDRSWRWNAYPGVWGPFEIVGANTVD